LALLETRLVTQRATAPVRPGFLTIGDEVTRLVGQIARIKVMLRGLSVTEGAGSLQQIVIAPGKLALLPDNDNEFGITEGTPLGLENAH
jgi:hypothetical protein